MQLRRLGNGVHDGIEDIRVEMHKPLIHYGLLGATGCSFDDEARQVLAARHRGALDKIKFLGSYAHIDVAVSLRCTSHGQPPSFVSSPAQLSCMRWPCERLICP